MGYISNVKTIKILRILENMTINDNDTIINNDFNSFTNSLNNKSLENEKRNENINIAIII